jgi:hypothetical protein
MSSLSSNRGQARHSGKFYIAGQASVEYIIAVMTVVLLGGIAFQAFIGALRGYYSFLSFLIGLPIP